MLGYGLPAPPFRSPLVKGDRERRAPRRPRAFQADQPLDLVRRRQRPQSRGRKARSEVARRHNYRVGFFLSVVVKLHWIVRKPMHREISRPLAARAKLRKFYEKPILMSAGEKTFAERYQERAGNKALPRPETAYEIRRSVEMFRQMLQISRIATAEEQIEQLAILVEDLARLLERQQAEIDRAGKEVDQNAIADAMAGRY